ncbi:MAG: hypothetical protein HYX74_09600 [Acidobacteria bacterium]|nr:hypothetical protein [Acidobacteriota bacterium]
MPPLRGAAFAAEIPLLPLIEEAKSRLEKETVVYHPGTGGKPASREVKLALADFRTGQIRIVPAIEANGNFRLQDPSIRYEVEWWNGFNSTITILDPEHTAVVALLYALPPDQQRLFGQDAIIYTPYSSALLQPELVEAGRTYLMEKIATARRELLPVQSRAFPGLSLADSPAFTDENYFSLILIEHMDPGRFRAIESREAWGEEQEKQLLLLATRILVIIGANQEDAYRFTGNYASARGLTQFTPMGMRVVWSKYPEAGIPSDFLQATSDHTSAVKAQICLMDHDLAHLAGAHPDLVGSGYEKYAVAAAYNGGPARVRYGLKNFGTQWLRPQARLHDLKSKRKRSRREESELRWVNLNRSHETFIYLEKLDAVENSQLVLMPDRLKTFPLLLLLQRTP